MINHEWNYAMLVRHNFWRVLNATGLHLRRNKPNPSIKELHGWLKACLDALRKTQ